MLKDNAEVKNDQVRSLIVLFGYLCAFQPLVQIEETLQLQKATVGGINNCCSYTFHQAFTEIVTQYVAWREI